LVQRLGSTSWIEDFRSGDAILSRPQHDINAPVRVQYVEEVFERIGRILHLGVNGRLIATTAEHPFYVRDQGWLPAGRLQPGDQFSTLEGGWLALDFVEVTHEDQKVYNLRVREDHTYFVGTDQWGFAVWAHNANCPIGYVGSGTVAEAADALRYRVTGRILRENARRGEDRFAQFFFANNQVMEVVTHARTLERVTGHDVESLLLFAHRNGKFMSPADLMTQMSALNQGRLRGFPAAFGSAESFSRFSDEFSSLVGSHGFPVNGILLQGSMLRRATPPDLDVLVVGTRNLFEQMAAQARRAVSGAFDQVDATRLLRNQIEDGRLNMAVLSRLGGGTFRTRMNQLLANLVADGILPPTVTKIDFSLTYPGTWHANEGLGPVWRLNQPGG